MKAVFLLLVSLSVSFALPQGGVNTPNFAVGNTALGTALNQAGVNSGGVSNTNIGFPPIYINDRDANGNYYFKIQTPDGQTREERGIITDRGLSVKGSYSYFGPDGNRYTVAYTAGEKGFEAEGEHLPNSAHALKKTPNLGVSQQCINALQGESNCPAG